MSDQLPSLDDLLESKLPSVDEFIKEEDLPSVDEFVEKEEEVIEEETIEEPVIEEAADLTEIVRLINDVRKDIPVVPEIPEIKYYDEELYITKITGNKITVERGKDGRTAASHLNGAEIKGITDADDALIEMGDDFGFSGEYSQDADLF